MEELNELREAAGLPYALNILGEFEERRMDIREALNVFYSDWDKKYQHQREWLSFMLTIQGANYMPEENSTIVISSSLADYFQFWGLARTNVVFSKNLRVTIEEEEMLMLVIPREVMDTIPEDGWELPASSFAGSLVLPFGVTGTIIKVKEIDDDNPQRFTRISTAGGGTIGIF